MSGFLRRKLNASLKNGLLVNGLYTEFIALGVVIFAFMEMIWGSTAVSTCLSVFV